jgi:YfiH family protein
VGFERRRLGRQGYALVNEPLASLGVLAAFTERTGGSSEAPYASLNVSLSVGDDPARVVENRHLVIRELDTDPYALVEQVHGSRIVRVGVKRKGAGFEPAGDPLARADGMTTASEGVGMAIQTADCMPMILASEREPLVAVVHAGWRGFASGIVAAGAALFEEPRAVRVAIGPTIGPCHYEVGEDVALAVAAGSDVGAVTEERAGGLFLDLVATAKRVLGSAGVRRVEDTELCTACETARFFSFRRDAVTGRQLALAMRRRKAA